MPGIFGFKLRRPSPVASRRAEALGDDLRRFPWQRSRVLEAASDRVYLGVAWNDVTSSARGGDSCSSDGIDCVVEGRIARTREDCEASAAVADHQPARAAILAYRRFGTDFASRLEGPFSLILYDRRRDLLLAATERHGLVPLYRHEADTHLAFCSLLGPMVRRGLVAGSIDPAAAATYLGHNHLFFQQSLIEDVVLQDAATVATAEGSEPVSVSRYWHYGHIGPRAGVPYRQRLDDVCDTLVAATPRLYRADDRLFTSLSGGMDSRLVTGLVLREGSRPAAWTFGTEGSSDLVISADICRRYDLEQRVYGPQPEQVLAHLESFVTLVNGCGPLATAFSLARAADLRGQADLILNGYRGGVLLGDAIIDLGLPHRLRWWKGRLGLSGPVVSPLVEHATTPAAMAAYYWALSHQAHPEVARWCTVPEPPVTGMVEAALLGPLAAVDPEYRIEQWTEEFGGGRHYTLLGIVADRHFHADGSHFYDYDVRDRCIALAPRDRRGRKAYVDVLERLVPDLARLTYANTGLPANARPWQVMAAKALRRVAGRRTALSTGAQPAQWIRRPEIRDHCADILRDGRARGRVWWHGDAVAAAFDDHLNGRHDLAAELWNAVSLEVFARTWLDPRESVDWLEAP